MYSYIQKYQKVLKSTKKIQIVYVRTLLCQMNNKQADRAYLMIIVCNYNAIISL